MERNMLRLLLSLSVIAGLLLASACHDDASSGGRRVEAKAEPVIALYPKGRWRLASLETLGKSVLWGSHILIRHEQSTAHSIAKPRGGGWQPEGPPPKRSRQAAFELAFRVANQLRTQPSAFATLAREYS